MRTLWLQASLISLTALTASARAADTPIVVLAATSLTDVLQEISSAYTQQAGQSITLQFAGSKALALQIESGTHADVFVPADTESMEYLDSRQLIDPKSRRDVLRNQLVLIAPSASAIKLKIAPNFALAAALGKGQLAIANPDVVAAGRYARYALISLGAWNAVSDRLLQADNVRTTLASVAHGEALLGIVYETDALSEKGVRIVDTFPATSHPAIVYPGALTVKARPGAARYLAFLRSDDARKIFARYGFRS